MLNSDLSAASSSLGGIRKVIQQNIRSTFQTFSSTAEDASAQDTFTRTTPAGE